VVRPQQTSDNSEDPHSQATESRGTVEA
jgi:hypothetical protein